MPERETGPNESRSPRAQRWIRWVAVAVMVVGLLWLIVDRLLAGYYPLRWGGPNIGGGLLILLCYAALIGGVTALWASDGLHPRTWSTWSWGAAVMVVVLLIGYIAVRIIQPRDEDAGRIGRMGVTVTTQGEPILVMMVCRGSIDRVRVVGPNRTPQFNEELATYTSVDPVSGYQELNLLDPSVGWQTGSPLTQSTLDGQMLVIASARSDKAVLTDVSFSSEDLRSLTPGLVQSASGQWAQRRPVDEFRAAACP
ncbi:cell division protein CrgA [Nakamurella flava]|uniref:Cell division protein CrgA n=1 Tax=Nakamurella flava TaxID=2576308 RepID=A0A4U6QKZ6_9ACTN|nr:cell division protein CrgA [Nakamurella flava]TKV61011.1 cell division protein CrgA [Nakamurella flava]